MDEGDLFMYLKYIVYQECEDTTTITVSLPWNILLRKIYCNEKYINT